MHLQLGGGLAQLLMIDNELRHFVRRGVRLGLIPGKRATVTQLIAGNDDNLLRKMLYNEHHVLKQLLPGKTNHQCAPFRQRRHKS